MNTLRRRALLVLVDIAEDQTVSDEDRIQAAMHAIYGTADNEEAVDQIADRVVAKLRATAVD